MYSGDEFFPDSITSGPDDDDPETPAERRAALMSAMEGGYAAPEDFPIAERCDGFRAGNAWGPCAACGDSLADHHATR